MHKFLFCFLLSSACWSQKLHHQTIASIGINSKINNGMIVSQSIGQSNVSIGNYKNSTLIIGQGYIQSFGIAKSALPIEEVITMMVYPNPVIDIVNFIFSYETRTKSSFHLFDSRGRLIAHQIVEPKQNSFTYDLSTLAQGVYFAKIETTNQSFTTKILKSK